MIKFEELRPELVEILKENSIEEKDLENNYSDLYIGCSSFDQAGKIRSKIPKHAALTSTFFPQEGSSMDHHKICVEVAFGYMDGYFDKKYGKRNKST